MHFSPELRDQAVRLLLSGVGIIEATPGCQSCTVEQNAIEENWISFTEKWDSEETFSEHLKTDVFRRVLSAMDMCLEAPQVTLGSLSGFSGISYLNELYERSNFPTNQPKIKD
jgi:quinol monooxygenase YgiN